MTWHRSRARAVLALAVFVALAGCRKPSPPSPGAASTATPAPASFSPSASAVKLTAQVLAPVIRESALPGELPDRIVVELARDAAPERAVGKASEKTVVSLSPSARAVAIWERASTLAVKPEEPLQYDTAYTVKLERIETRDGVLAEAQPWTYQFRTPPFGLVRLDLGKLDLEKGKAEVEVVFSGPVRAEAVSPYLTWQVAGRRIPGPRLSGTERPNVVRAAVSGRLEGATIEVALRAGAPALRRGVTAPAGEASVAIPGGEPVTIHAAHLKEGTTGFYVDVVCDDQASKGQRRHYWDPEMGDSIEISRQCVLTAEDAAHMIHLAPGSKPSVAPGPGGFRVFGDFTRGPLTVTIDAGARTEAGGVLQEKFTRTFTVPARKPALSFATGGRYLPRSAWRSLPVSHTNVDGAELAVRQIPPENLVFWLSDERDERATERTSNLLVTKTLPFTGPQDRPATTWVDVASLLPASTKGVLEISLAGGGVRTSARLLLTQMNLVAKRSLDPKDRWKQEVRVWALDIDSTELLSGVEITVVRKSGKAVGRCTTSGEDGCAVQVGRDDADESEPFAILARKGDDQSYIRYADLKSDTSDADVAGEPFAAESAYKVALWTERGVYRPGEAAHLAGIVRGRDHRAPPAGMPVELQLQDPRAKVARRMVLKTNEAGLVAVDLPFGAYADTGRYQVVALAGDRQIGSHAFNVEEFVPERMKVQAAVARPAYLLGDAAKVSVEARYLFGGSAEGSSVEVTCSLAPATFRPAKENAQFTYGPQPEKGARPVQPAALGAVQGSLDEAGRVTVECPGGQGAFAGPARLVASAAVFEAGSGRSSVGEATAAVHPEKFYVGLQSGAKRAQEGKPFSVTGVVVDWNGALAPRAAPEVSVELVRLEPEYGWWWDEEGGGESYKPHVRRVSEGRRTVKVEGGRFTAELTPTGWGLGYLVRVTAARALTELPVEGDTSGWYWDGGEQQAEQTPRPLKATSLAVELPRSVKVGEKAAARLVIPFRGRVLLTLETDKVVAHEWKKVEPGELTWQFSVPAFSPNVYLSALLVKDPHLESAQAFLPDRAFGVASTVVEPVEFTAPLKLEAPAEVRSSSPLTVKLDVGKPEGPTFAVVAAVDEGILQLTRMKSPDPLEVIFAKRALGVDTFETIGWTLLVKPQGPSKSSGGDGGSGAAGRVQPVKPVALWSGVVPVGPDGKVEVKLDVPQYRGQLRVMAVTAGPGRMGRAAASVTVKDPIVLSTTLPRFAVKDDLMQIPVFLTNLSGAPQVVRVTLAAEPLPVPGMAPSPLPQSPLVFVGKNEGSARLADGASATLVFQVRASTAVGAAKLRVVARAGSFESREELDVPFLPAGPRERVVKRIEVTSDEVDLKPALEGWVPTSERSTFWLTANPYGESFDHLKYLLHYPYGCVEQTTSSARPLLFVANLVDSVDPAYTAGGKIEEMVMAGVNRLLAMQTKQGGLSYWPGGAEPYAWGTAYATHFLIDAQKAGYPVPQDRLDEILRWAEEEVARFERGEKRDHPYSWEGPTAEAYLHYVLALSGKGHKARLQRLIEETPARPDGEAMERRYMLQAALYLAGDRRYEQELRNPDASAVSEERHNNWWFYSDRRRRGFMLSTFQDLFGNDPGGEALAQRVAEGLRRPSRFYTTQELVWGVTGLGKRVGAVDRAFKAGRLLADGKAIEARPPRGNGSDRSWGLARASEYRTLALEVKDRGQGKLWLLVSSEGVRVKPEVQFGGKGLKLARTWRTLDGGAVDPRSQVTPLAGLLFVELEVTNETGEDVQNVAVVDRIPAGFEIENPRLGRGTRPEWAGDDLWTPDYMDVRDHELAIFGKIPARGTARVIYAVRAVTAGTFTLPPAEAEAMYDPATWAREAGGKVEVGGPWKDNLL
jgi:alpha-2-macroglobulin